jgi:hypothetical protein
MNRSAGTSNGPIASLAEDWAQDYYAVQYPYPLITLSAGNCINSVPQVVDCASPNAINGVNVTNRSYNTLVVGASDVAATPQTSDDFIAEFSQYANPVTTHNDFELPNLVAPGSDNHADISSASTQNRGTSGAAPIVLGTAMLMKAQDIFFDSWPELSRATIMAASTHPVEATRTTSLAAGDRKQGAGLLNANVAVQLADPSVRAGGPNNSPIPRGRHARTYDFSTDFPNGGFSDPYQISTTTNGRLRVVAAWDATATNCSSNGSGCQGETPNADLDLWVSQWNGSAWVTVCTSASWDSTWELCDIPVSTGESYKAELRKWSTNAPYTYLGIAWNNYDPSSE